MIMKTNAIVNVVRTSRNGKKVVFEQSNIFSTLISKEFRKFFNTPIYALNCGFGLVLLAIGAIASLIFKADLVPYLTMAIGLELPIASLILLVAGFCVSMVYTTAISLSLEGKNFWVLRSLPISPKTIMQAKLAFNIILCLPLAIVSIGLLSISLEIEFWTMIVMMLAISSLSFVTSSMGSVINLYLPKFDFLNDTEIVKQNMAALVGVFGGFGIIAADAFLYYGLDIIFSPEISLLLVAVVNSILGCGFYLWMNRSCENLFIKMTA
jgi:ABC-2 type transport system permease protein